MVKVPKSGERHPNGLFGGAGFRRRQISFQSIQRPSSVSLCRIYPRSVALVLGACPACYAEDDSFVALDIPSGLELVCCGLEGIQLEKWGALCNEEQAVYLGVAGVGSQVGLLGRNGEGGKGGLEEVAGMRCCYQVRRAHLSAPSFTCRSKAGPFCPSTSIAVCVPWTMLLYFIQYFKENQSRNG
jgi:hypothetical protein